MLEKIDALQAPIKEKYGSAKKWSRETFLKIALDNTNTEYKIDQLIQAVDNYWIKISEVAEVFPGTVEFLEKIQSAGGTRVFVTSSDARLTYDGKVFDYDPKYSEAKKRTRIDALAKLGIKYDYLSIGDPEDKPDPAFFQKAIDLVEKAQGEKLNLSEAVIIGDSFNSDIKTPIEQMGFGIGVVFKKDQSEVIWETDNLVSTGNLLTLIS